MALTPSTNISKQTTLHVAALSSVASSYQSNLMLIATWNVNSILVRMPNVIRWLDAVKPDVLCMQETKCTDDKFPTLLFQERGYQCQLFGQQAYNGVAILTREACDTSHR